jgi:hypothetical protein
LLYALVSPHMLLTVGSLAVPFGTGSQASKEVFQHGTWQSLIVDFITHNE